MNRYTHVEDYLEVIAGYKDSATLKTNGANMWQMFEPIISLARYDVNVIESMADAAIANRALTTRQGDLAIKIILKYKRQLAQKDIDVAPVEQAQWRVPLRVMDYSKRLYIEDDKIIVDFPFSNALIESLRDFRKDSQGSGQWVKDKRRWEFALTEYNLVYLHTWAKGFEFDIDEEADRLNNLIAETEDTPYAIELDYYDGEFTIKNAPTSLQDYINEHCGGFTLNNLERLVDLAPVLGYTISKDIAYAWEQQYGAFNLFLSTHRECKMPHEHYERVLDILDYADITQRYPVVIYEPDTTDKMWQYLIAQRDPSTIYKVQNKRGIETIPEGVKYIYTPFPIKNINIALLVSTAGMMFGGEKNYMVQNTDKAVYFAPEIYTNKKDHKVPEFESNISNQG